jgi:CMP-2-keto-3-deoxyoctulosonic acid synthetase
VKSFGGEARMTRSDHATGTDRIGEVAALQEAGRHYSG